MSGLAIRLFCNECKRSVIMEREFFLDILLKWRDSNPDSNEEEILTFRCDDCALSLMRRVPRGLIPLTQVTATVGLAADLKAAEDESNPGPPKMADHAFGFLCRSPTGPEVGKSGKQ
jgi:hypothetical protein